MNQKIKAVLAALNKGNPGIVMALDDDRVLNPRADAIQTGIFSLDHILGGGLPRGRIIELWGPSSCGKTTLAYHCLASAQKVGVAAMIDMESTADPQYAKVIGVDPTTLIFSQPDNGEQALEVVENLTRSGEVCFIVVDSVAALVPQAEIEKGVSKDTMGKQAHLMSKHLRIINPLLSESKTTILYINQTRSSMSMYGPSQTTCGGQALGFYSTIRMEAKRKEINMTEGEGESQIVSVKTVKNKIYPPYKTAELKLVYGQGIDLYDDIAEALINGGVLDKTKGWIRYQGETLCNGKEKLCTLLKEKEGLKDELLGKLQESKGSLRPVQSEASEEDGGPVTQGNDSD